MGCQEHTTLWAAPAQTDCRKICTGTLMPCEMVKLCCAPPTSCTSGSAAAALVNAQVVLSVWPSQSVTISVTLYVPACVPLHKLNPCAHALCPVLHRLQLRRAPGGAVGLAQPVGHHRRHAVCARLRPTAQVEPMHACFCPVQKLRSSRWCCRSGPASRSPSASRCMCPPAPQHMVSVCTVVGKPMACMREPGQQVTWQPGSAIHPACMWT